MHIDSKYGHVATALGMTATIIAVFRTIVTKESARWVIEHRVLEQCIERAIKITSDWVSMVFIGSGVKRGGEEAKDEMVLPTTLCAERRALFRARVGIRAALAKTRKNPPGAFMSLQIMLDYATAAAFPPRCVKDTTQAGVVSEISDSPGEFFGAIGRQAKADAEALMRLPRIQNQEYIPLSSLPLCLPVGGQNSSDTSSSYESAVSVISSVSSWELVTD